MIERIQAYKVGEETFANLADAQAHKLKQIVIAAATGAISEPEHKTIDQIVKALVKALPETLDALTTGPRSKAKSRSINGATRKKRVATPVTEKAV